MISLRRLRRNSKMKRVSGFLDTKEKVRKARKELENKTENTLRDSQIAKFFAWGDSRFIMLD